MRTCLLICALSAYPASSVFGQAVVPAEVAANPGEFAVVEADCHEGTAVSWYGPDAGLSVIPPRLLRDPRSAVCMAGKPGRYRLVCFTAVGEGGRVTMTGPHVCTVVVGTPGPDDPLAAKLRDAFDNEASSDRYSQLRKLAELYRQAGDVARRPEVNTAGKLFAVLSKAASELGLGGALPKVQAAVRSELVTVLPTDPNGGFDPALAAAVFGKIARALENINDDE